jgi:predicted dehydrogenase
MTGSSAGGRSAADRFGFEFCTGSVGDILNNSEINTVFIASRHDTHGQYVIQSLKAGKHVFVEKPLCLAPEELDEIREICLLPDAPILLVGFNRRFSPLTREMARLVMPEKVAITYRINTGAIAPDSWIQDREIGGGRIVGEVCHFVDYLSFLSRSHPRRIHALAMDDPHNNDDTVVITLKYANGSVGSIQYLANGSKELPKERIELYSSGTTAILNDFRELEVHGNGKPFRKRLLSQDKGQKDQVRLFIEAVKDGLPSPIPLDDIFSTTDVTFKVLDCLRTGKAVEV